MSTYFYVWMPCYIGYIDMVSPQYVASYDIEVYHSEQNIYHIGCIDMVSPQCVLLFDM